MCIWKLRDNAEDHCSKGLLHLTQAGQDWKTRASPSALTYLSFLSKQVLCTFGPRSLPLTTDPCGEPGWLLYQSLSSSIVRTSKILWGPFSDYLLPGLRVQCPVPDTFIRHSMKTARRLQWNNNHNSNNTPKLGSGKLHTHHVKHFLSQFSAEASEYTIGTLF